jgi:hypothetical protein
MDPTSDVLHNTQFEVIEKFPGGPLDRMLHAFYNVENDLYLKMLLGDGKSASADKLKRIMDANKKSQKDVFKFANSNPIIKKGIDVTPPTAQIKSGYQPGLSNPNPLVLKKESTKLVSKTAASKNPAAPRKPVRTTSVNSSPLPSNPRAGATTNELELITRYNKYEKIPVNDYNKLKST